MAESPRIESVPELERLIEQSRSAPVMLFKHSLICPISTAAFRQYQQFLEQRPADDGVIYGLVEIQNARDVSNEIASRTGVRHESPQALLLTGGEAVWHASHGSIRAEALAAAIDASS